MRLTGAQIVTRVLLEQGCDTVFGYPGGQVLALYDALYQKRRQIRHIRTAHEQGAAHAADGYARATGKVGVVMSTSGPGATNLVTGIATACLDSVPLLAITSNVPDSLIGKDAFQEIDIAGVTMPITKHNFFVNRIEELADTLREAFVIARSGRPGPVLVDITKDVTAATYEYENKRPLPLRPDPEIRKDDIRAAVKMIAKTWLKSAKIRDVGAYFAVSDAPKEIGAWDSRLQVSSRGYMLGYNDLKDPSVSRFFRFLAKVGDGMMKMQIVKIRFGGKQ